ncbi:MAG: hypothetical protein ACLVCT_02840 [Lachnospira sp.]
MMYNEEEMLHICKKHNIDVVKKEGLPLYNGEEMNENFSFENLMHESILLFDTDIISSSECFNFSLPVYYDHSNEYNDYSRTSLNNLEYKNEKCNNEYNFVIPTNNENKYAA